MMLILEVHWTIELELKYIIVQHLCIVCEIHLSIKWTYESIQRECNILMIIISQKNTYLPFLRQEKFSFFLYAILILGHITKLQKILLTWLHHF